VAVLLPPGPAGLCALAGVAIAEILLRRPRGLYPCDIATQVGRWTILVALASLIVHLPLFAGNLYPCALVGVAAFLWTGDVLTSPLLLHPITGEPSRTIIRSVVKGVGVLEAGQYVIGMLGAIAARQALWSVALLAVPIFLVYVTSKRNMELQDGTQLLLGHMADTVDLRDPYTGGHSRRVTEHTKSILKELGMHGPDVALTIMAARLHDIGQDWRARRRSSKDGQAHRRGVKNHAAAS